MLHGNASFLQGERNSLILYSFRLGQSQTFRKTY